DYVYDRCDLAFDVDVNAAGNDVQRANQGDEADVFVCGFKNVAGGMEAEEIIGQCNCAEPEDDFGVMLQPPNREREWRPGNCDEQQHKRQNHPRVDDKLVHGRKLRRRQSPVKQKRLLLKRCYFGVATLNCIMNRMSPRERLMLCVMMALLLAGWAVAA